MVIQQRVQSNTSAVYQVKAPALVHDKTPCCSTNPARGAGKHCSHLAIVTPSRRVRACLPAFGCCFCPSPMSPAPGTGLQPRGAKTPCTWCLPVAPTFFPDSAGPAAIRHKIPVSSSPTSGHTWRQHQLPASSPAAPAGPICPCATPTWAVRKPPVSTQQGCDNWERENRFYLCAREDFNNGKDNMETT